MESFRLALEDFHPVFRACSLMALTYKISNLFCETEDQIILAVILAFLVVNYGNLDVLYPAPRFMRRIFRELENQ